LDNQQDGGQQDNQHGQSDHTDEKPSQPTGHISEPEVSSDFRKAKDKGNPTNSSAPIANPTIKFGRDESPVGVYSTLLYSAQVLMVVLGSRPACRDVHGGGAGV
jgi:hypothetical protein